MQAFSLFDADGNGYIDVDELSTIMAKLGQTLDQKQLKVRIKKKYENFKEFLQEMIMCADINKDTKISFSEFQKLMLSPLWNVSIVIKTCYFIWIPLRKRVTGWKIIVKGDLFVIKLWQIRTNLPEHFLHKPSYLSYCSIIWNISFR